MGSIDAEKLEVTPSCLHVKDKVFRLTKLMFLVTVSIVVTVSDLHVLEAGFCSCPSQQASY